MSNLEMINEDEIDPTEIEMDEENPINIDDISVEAEEEAEVIHEEKQICDLLRNFGKLLRKKHVRETFSNSYKTGFNTKKWSDIQEYYESILEKVEIILNHSIHSSLLSNETRGIIEVIGEELNNIGGVSLMQAVYYLVRDAQAYFKDELGERPDIYLCREGHVSELSKVWDGIGDWDD